jgi:hypothetical protein
MMIWTIKDESGSDRYQVRPNPGGLCFEVWEWQGEHKGRGRGAGRVIPAGWAHLGKYPTTLAHAFRIIAERAAIVWEGEAVIRWCERQSRREAAYLDGWVSSALQEA